MPMLPVEEGTTCGKPKPNPVVRRVNARGSGKTGCGVSPKTMRENHRLVGGESPEARRVGGIAPPSLCAPASRTTKHMSWCRVGYAAGEEPDTPEPVPAPQSHSASGTVPQRLFGNGWIRTPCTTLFTSPD